MGAAERKNFVSADASYSHPDSPKLALIFSCSVADKFHACHIVLYLSGWYLS